MATKYPKRIDELPEAEFYAILKPASMTIPGDERSRTNPGHGYPEHSVDYWEMETFPSQAEWEAEVRRLSLDTGYYRQPFKAVKITPARIAKTVTVDISEAS